MGSNTNASDERVVKNPKGNPLRPDKPDPLEPAPRRGVRQDDPTPAGSVRPTPKSPDE